MSWLFADGQASRSEGIDDGIRDAFPILVSASARSAGPTGFDAVRTLGFGLLGALLGVGLILGKDWLYTLQGGVSNLAELLPFGYAYAAGMVAAFNPCGILLVPSLVAYYLGSEQTDGSAWLHRAGRAVVFGVTATVGFVALFALVGAIFVASGRVVGSAFPIGGLAVGLGMAVLALWMLATDRSLGVASASRAMGFVRVEARTTSLLVFGVAYGVASLACTLPIFLVVVGSALAVRGPIESIAQFVSYATGMGTMLTVVVTAAAFFRDFVLSLIRGAMPQVHRLSASMLLGAGIFIVHYWLGPSGLLR